LTIVWARVEQAVALQDDDAAVGLVAHLDRPSRISGARNAAKRGGAAAAAW
jgi:hypothetical protein